jgi:glycosyltransferase involved in cell wall biosynthesis
MASGAAVVASDIGGIPEAAGDAGVLVPPHDAGALADALSELAGDRALLARLRTAARTHAEAHDWVASRGVLDRELARLGMAVASTAV